MALPPLPKILTNADWQAEKGVIAKLTKGETGIGALMDALTNAYNAIDAAKFDCRTAIVTVSQRTPENIDKAIAEAKAEYPKVQVAQKAAYALRDRAKVVAAEFAKSKVIPASTRKHVETIAVEADHFGVACKSMDFKSFDDVRKEETEKQGIARKMLAGWVASIKTGYSAVLSKTTGDEYIAKMYQKVRGLGTAVANIPELKAKWSPIFGNGGYSKGDYIKKDDKPEVIKTKTKAIMTSLAQFESEIK
jgi:hypothetical protein